MDNITGLPCSALWPARMHSCLTSFVPSSGVTVLPMLRCAALCSRVLSWACRHPQCCPCCNRRLGVYSLRQSRVCSVSTTVVFACTISSHCQTMYVLSLSLPHEHGVPHSVCTTLVAPDPPCVPHCALFVFCFCCVLFVAHYTFTPPQ